MTRTPETRPAPFSLRLSFDERAQLERDALGQSLSSYIKERLFSPSLGSGGGGAQRRRKRRTPVKDEKLLAQLLAALGHTRLSQNMNQIAKAAHMGALPVPEELERDLRRACADIHAMRVLLLKGLGFKAPESPRDPESATQSFSRAHTDTRSVNGARARRRRERRVDA